MKEILLDPAIIALIGVIFTGLLGLFQQQRATKAKFYRSNLSMDEKKMRLLRWNQEKYNYARMLMIQNGLGHLVDEFLPFDPPKDLMLYPDPDEKE